MTIPNDVYAELYERYGTIRRAQVKRQHELRTKIANCETRDKLKYVLGQVFDELWDADIVPQLTAELRSRS